MSDEEMDRETVASVLGLTVGEVADIEASALAKMRVALVDFADESAAPIPPVKISDPYRARLASKGKCTFCRHAPARPGRRMCASCNVRANEYVRTSRARKASVSKGGVRHGAE